MVGQAASGPASLLHDMLVKVHARSYVPSPADGGGAGSPREARGCGPLRACACGAVPPPQRARGYTEGRRLVGQAASGPASLLAAMAQPTFLCELGEGPEWRRLGGCAAAGPYSVPHEMLVKVHARSYVPSPADGGGGGAAGGGVGGGSSHGCVAAAAR